MPSSKMPNETKYDVAIIGGGPAGSSAGRYAAMYGLKVVVFEKGQYPRDKPCGGALSSQAEAHLGEKALSSLNCRITRLDMYSPSLKMVNVENERGHFVIRSEFDAAMAEDAKIAGADVFDDNPVSKIRRLESGKYRIVAKDRTVTARYVIMATGVQTNRLIKDLGIRKRWPEGHLAMCAESETKVDNRVLDQINGGEKPLKVFFGIVPKGYGWYFVKDGYLNIGIGSTWQDIKNEAPKEMYGDFVGRLKDMGLVPEDLELEKPKHHLLVFKKPAERTVFDNVILAGDAAGFVNPLTGEGLYYSILSGKLAAEAIRNNMNDGKPIKSYEDAWKDAFGRDLASSGLLLQKIIYKSPMRQEFLVALGRHDEKMGVLLREAVFREVECRETIKKVILRMPISLIKLIF